MLLAYNTDRDQTNPPVPDDCYAALATLDSLGHDLIQANVCLIGGTTTGDILGPDPFLGPRPDNGGPTLTQAPLRGSPRPNGSWIARCCQYATDVLAAGLVMWRSAVMVRKMSHDLVISGR